MKINKIAGFWIRFSSLLIDVIIFVLISISSSLLIIRSKQLEIWNNQLIYQVDDGWTYYLWFLIPILLLILQFLLIPLLTNGKNLGQLICRIKVIKTNKDDFNKIIIFKRWQLGPLIWIIIIIMFMMMVRPEVINKVSLYTFVQNHQDDFQKLAPVEQNEIIKSYQFNSWETALLSIPGTTSTFNILIQMLMLISISINKEKVGLLDKLTNSKIIYVNKFLIKNENSTMIIKPKLNSTINITWKN